MAGGLRLTAPEATVGIRPCAEDDLGELSALGSAHHVTWCRERFAREDVTILVAVDGDGRIVGKLHVEFGNTEDGTPQIVAASVVPQLQSRGIGTALMEAAESLACAAGHRIVELGVEDSNPRARRLYERLGYEFARSGEFVYPGAPDPNPGVWLRKELTC
jgi:ribosomal protein S18 acetylase RimI-like enzyme